jgi:hypothetical protein
VSEPNGWNEWSKFVLKELERLNTCYNALDSKVSKIQTEIAMLKVKSGVWGAVAGIIAVVVAVLVKTHF